MGGRFGGDMNFGVAMNERSICEYLSRACAHLNCRCSANRRLPSQTDGGALGSRGFAGKD